MTRGDVRGRCKGLDQQPRLQFLLLLPASTSLEMSDTDRVSDGDAPIETSKTYKQRWQEL
jgi:hypothetical protein